MASSGAVTWQFDASRNIYYYDTAVEGGWQRVYQDNSSYFIPADYAASYATPQASSAQDPRTAYHHHLSQTSLQGQTPYRDRTRSDASENYGYTVDNLASATSQLQLTQERSTVEYAHKQEGRPYHPQAYGYAQDQRYHPSGHSTPTATSAQNPNYVQECATPKGTTKQFLRGSSADFKDQKLDSAFRRRKMGFFKVGKVFKAPWPEIAGYNTTKTPTVVSDIAYGENVYTKIRWFVVVKTGNLSCSCLPIQTYGGRGASGSHLRRSHHAIIYTGDVVPSPDPAEAPPPGESPLGTAIRVDPKKATDKLDPMSRVNFSKVYPVEHNVKVYDFGQVHSLSEAWLLYQFKSVFDLSDLPSTAPLEEADEESSEAEGVEDTSQGVEDPEIGYYQGKGKDIAYE